jgi:hypothetical protein
MRVARPVALVVLAVTGLPAWAPRAQACDSTACLQATRGGGSVQARGSWRVDVSLRSTDDTDSRRGGHETDQVLRPKVYFEQQRVVPFFHQDRDGRGRFLQVDVGYGLFARTTVYASIPAATQRLQDVRHGAVTTAYDVWGVGDGLVGVRQALALRGALVGGLAVKTPLGRSGLLDSYDGTVLEPTLQPGSGAWGLVSSLQYSSGPVLRDVSWSASASQELTTTNARAYRFGADSIGTLGLSRPLGRLVTASLQGKLFHKGRSTYRGVGVGSTGGTTAYLTPGLRVRGPAAVGLYAYFQVPVYRYVNETQLAPRRGWLVGINRSF